MSPAGDDDSDPDGRDGFGADELAFMRKVGVAMFFVGAITLLATLSLPDPDPSDHSAIGLIAGLLALGGVAVIVMNPLRLRWMRVCVIYGILLVSALMAVTRPIEATPFFYLWPMLFSAYFFTRRDVIVDLSVMWVTLAVALFVFSVDPMKAVLFMGVGVSVSLTCVVVMLLRERLTRAIGELEQASATDYLTGLLNRRAFDAEFLRQIERARRSQCRLSIVLFDLDHFKQINDRLGHAAGDVALRRFAALLQEEHRTGDSLARIGGEEFAAVLFDTDSDSALEFAERLGRRLAEPSEDGSQLSTSAGIAELSDRQSTPSDLLNAADRALYHAKQAGRRRIAVWADGSVEVCKRLDVLPDLAVAG